jgi:hypothetical protein
MPLLTRDTEKRIFNDEMAAFGLDGTKPQRFRPQLIGLAAAVVAFALFAGLATIRQDPYVQPYSLAGLTPVEHGPAKAKVGTDETARSH